MLGTVLVVDVNMLLLCSSQGIILSMFVFEGVLLGQHPPSSAFVSMFI